MPDSDLPEQKQPSPFYMAGGLGGDWPQEAKGDALPHLESPHHWEVARAGRGLPTPAAGAGMNSRCWSLGGLEDPQSKARAVGVGEAFEILKTTALHLLQWKHLVFLRAGPAYPAGNTSPTEGQDSDSEGRWVMSPASAAWLPAGAVSATAWPGSALAAGWRARGPWDRRATNGTPDGLPAARVPSAPFQLDQCTFPSPVLAAHGPVCVVFCGSVAITQMTSSEWRPSQVRQIGVLSHRNREQRTKTTISCQDTVIDERADK